MDKATGYKPEPVVRYGEDFPLGFVVDEWPHGASVPLTSTALVGDMLPKVPFTTVAKQKIVKEYYPGNPEPGVQVLGAREEPVTIKGEFKAIRFPDKSVQGAKGSGKLRDVPAAMMQNFDEIRKRGNLLQLRLGEWERWGYLTSATFNMKTRQSIEYELEFDIMSQTRPENAKLVEESARLPNDTNRELVDAAETFSRALDAAPPTMPQTLLDIVGKAIATVAAKIALVTGFVDASVESLEDAQRLANKGVGLVKGAQASISEYKRRLGAIQAYNVEPSALTIRIPASQGKLKNQKYVSEAMLSTAKKNTATGVTNPRSIEEILAEMKEKFAALATLVPLRRHIVGEGESLQKISMRYYGTAENWEAIYKHNKLQTTELVVGVTLEIPKV